MKKNQLFVVGVLALVSAVSSAGVVNGSFENGLDGWTDWGSSGVLVTGDGSSGTQCAALQNLGNKVQQQISGPLAIGQTYTLTLDLKNPLPAGNGNVVVKTVMFAQNSGWDIIAADEYWISVASGSGWVSSTSQSDISFVMPTNAAWFFVECSLQLNENNAGVRLDNFQVAVTPEPMTMSLLGLGGMALIRRRK